MKSPKFLQEDFISLSEPQEESGDSSLLPGSHAGQR
jgi:hypothetical protein